MQVAGDTIGVYIYRQVPGKTDQSLLRLGMR